MRNVLSIDMEDYFHPSEVQQYCPVESWGTMPSRIEQSTLRLLDLLDGHGVRATFFILGWVAERHPAVVHAVAAAGHEIGCHSYAHQLVYDLTPEQFREDTRRAVEVIHHATGVVPRCYRAPSYSITKSSLWALDILSELGFTHDSSIYPIHHDRYGIPSFPRHAQLLQTTSGPLKEVPVATVCLPGSRVAPVGGGGYLRLLPYRYTAAGVRRINRDDRQPATLYAHPWEIDDKQPRLTRGILSSARTYMGLSGMFGKLDRLLREFEFAPLGEVYA